MAVVWPVRAASRSRMLFFARALWPMMMSRARALVRPGDLDLGGGMDTFAEDLAERIRETDPDAVAIFSYWPRMADVSPADHTCQVRWLSSPRLTGCATAACTSSTVALMNRRGILVR